MKCVLDADRVLVSELVVKRPQSCDPRFRVTHVIGDRQCFELLNAKPKMSKRCTLHMYFFVLGTFPISY